MVEFVIILIIVMAVCAGMCASIRLLTYQFWARQEARFLAFERVWSADDFYTETGNDPASLLNAGTDIGRPAIVTARDHSRTTQDDGTVTDLLSWLRPGRSQPASDADESAPIRSRKNSNSVLLARTTPGEMLSWLNTAFARQDDVGTDSLSPDELPVPEPYHPSPLPRHYPVPTGSKEKIGRGFQNIFNEQGFGPKFCDVAAAKLKSAGVSPGEFGQSDCGRRLNEELGMYLGENLDLQEMFQDYGDRLQWGDAPDSAFQESIRHSVGMQFYSFFDTLVSSSRPLALGVLFSESAAAISALAGSDAIRYVTDLRYVGSSLAVLAVQTAGGVLTGTQLTQTNPDTVLQNERNFVVNILHVDADDTVGGAAFFLSPLYLPVPPTFGPTAPAFQEAAMKNALFEDSSLVDRLIENSNKKVRVNYKAAGGLFPAATRRFAGIENVELTSNFYIVAQPWHITRRVSATGNYREKGDEFDDIDANTEEGVLRRRVSGLWLFPSNIGAFLQPVAAIPGLGFLGPVFSAFEPIGSIIGFVKHFVLVDNPIFKILDALHDIPGIGALVPTVPKWPAVRPDAYVGSTEMTGNSAGSKDKLMGGDRNFSDYIDEQRQFNPEPDPTFN